MVQAPFSIDFSWSTCKSLNTKLSVHLFEGSLLLVFGIIAFIFHFFHSGPLDPSSLPPSTLSNTFAEFCMLLRSHHGRRNQMLSRQLNVFASPRIPMNNFAQHHFRLNFKLAVLVNLEAQSAKQCLTTVQLDCSCRHHLVYTRGISWFSSVRKCSFKSLPSTKTLLQEHYQRQLHQPLLSP